MKDNIILASPKQMEAIKTFFDEETEDMLYGWWARWWKSEVIGIILAICIAAFPGWAWLLSRTQLSDLKATTLATFHSVIKRFGFWDKSYRDKIRDERHIEFTNGSRLFVIQTNLEPWDPEFDRVWSYWYSGACLDEAQQMANKLREVLSGRLSELDGSFETEVPMKYAEYTEEQMNPGYRVKFGIVWETQKNKEDIKTKDYKEIILDNGRFCVVVDYYELIIPYKLLKAEKKWKKLIHTYGWSFKGIIFSSCNPWTNFTKTDFYNPYKKWSLPIYRKFIPSLVWDNPWVDDKYIERLQRLPEWSVRKQRLLYGNFDYDDNPWILYDQNTISKMFDREPEGDDTMFIVVDAARQGKDGTEIGIWEGLHLKEIINISKADLVTQANMIQEYIDKHGVYIDHVIVDEVWVWGWLVDILGCRGFIWNSQPMHPYSSKLLTYKKRNYLNLRTQAFYYLQRYMKHITITTNGDTQDRIIEELLTVKEKDVANDGKMQIIKKADMKEELGRSPDLADMISMRMWWLIKEHFDGEIPEEDKAEEDKKDEFLEWLMEDEDADKSTPLDLRVY